MEKISERFVNTSNGEYFREFIFVHPKNTELHVVFIAHPEYELPEIHFELSEDIKSVQKRLDNGFLAAFFCAEVYVQNKIIEQLKSESSFLGCCSYETFSEFIGDDYFLDMVDEATEKYEILVHNIKEIL